MSKLIKLIAMASLTVGDGKKLEPGNPFEIDSDEGRRLVDRGFAREPEVEVPAKPSEERKARIAAEAQASAAQERAGQLQAQVDELEVDKKALLDKVTELTGEIETLKSRIA